MGVLHQQFPTTISVIMFAKKLVICMLVAFVAIAVSTRHQESPEAFEDDSVESMNKQESMNENGMSKNSPKTRLQKKPKWPSCPGSSVTSKLVTAPSPTIPLCSAAMVAIRLCLRAARCMESPASTKAVADGMVAVVVPSIVRPAGNTKGITQRTAVA